MDGATAQESCDRAARARPVLDAVLAQRRPGRAASELPGLLIRLSRALRREGRAAEAEEALRVAASRFPADARIWAEIRAKRAGWTEAAPSTLEGGLARISALAMPRGLQPDPDLLTLATADLVPEPGFPTGAAGSPAAPDLDTESSLRRVMVVMGLVVAAGFAIAIVRPRGGQILAPLYSVPVRIAPELKAEKPQPPAKLAEKAPSAAKAPPATPPQPSLPPETARSSPAARAPAALAGATRSQAAALASLPGAAVVEVTILYPAGAAGNAAELAARLARSGIAVRGVLPEALGTPGVSYVFDDDRPSAIALASLAGLAGQVRQAPAAPGSEVPPGTLRIVLPGPRGVRS